MFTAGGGMDGEVHVMFTAGGGMDGEVQEEGPGVQGSAGCVQHL